MRPLQASHGIASCVPCHSKTFEAHMKIHCDVALLTLLSSFILLLPLTQQKLQQMKRPSQIFCGLFLLLQLWSFCNGHRSDPSEMSEHMMTGLWPSRCCEVSALHESPVLMQTSATPASSRSRLSIDPSVTSCKHCGKESTRIRWVLLMSGKPLSIGDDGHSNVEQHSIVVSCSVGHGRSRLDLANLRRV